MASPRTRGFSGNLMLDSLPTEERQRLVNNAKKVKIPKRRVLFDQDESVDNVYFPLSGVVSLITLLEDGSAVEMATVGREGVVGVPMVLGNGLHASARGVSQVDGEALTLSAEVFRNELARADTLRSIVDSYVRALFTLVGQNAACNRLHTMEQRCARWLLITHDRVDGDEFDLTHEFLSQMLGSRRASVTESASSLQNAGAIRYHRGQITVVDRMKLQEKSCECYDVIRRAFDSLYQEAGAEDVRFPIR